MRVERCPSCGARYNVTRLATGARFACRRCGAVVVVGAADATPPPRRRRLGIFVAATLGLGTVGLRAVPSLASWASSEASRGATALDGLTLPEATALGVAALACLTALLVAFGLRGLALFAAAVTATWVVLRAQGPETPALSTAAPDPAGFLALVLLAAGAVTLATPRGDGRRTARALGAIGAALLVAGLASRFVAGRDEQVSVLADRARQVAAFWADTVWRGLAPAADADPWSREIPWTAQALAACLALALALVPARHAGGFVRALARTAFLLLLLAAIAPHLAAAWAVRDELLGAEGGPLFAHRLSAACWDDGLVPWLLGALLLAATAQERDAARRSSLPLPRPRSGARHLGLALVGLACALLLLNPWSGARALTWPWVAIEADAGGLAGTTAWLLGALVAGAAIAWLVPPTRRGGALVALCGALAACTLELGSSLHGVPRVAIPCLASMAAGGVWAQRGAPWGPGARSLVAGVGVVLLGLLLWPRPSPEVFGIEQGMGWPCALGSLAEGLATLGRPEGPTPSALFETGTASAALTATAALLALLAAASGPRRPLAVLLALVAIALALHPPVHAFVRTLAESSSGGAPPLEGGLAAAGRALFVHPAAAALATFVASAEAASGTQP